MRQGCLKLVRSQTPAPDRASSDTLWPAWPPPFLGPSKPSPVLPQSFQRTKS